MLNLILRALTVLQYICLIIVTILALYLAYEATKEGLHYVTGFIMLYLSLTWWITFK